MEAEGSTRTLQEKSPGRNRSNARACASTTGHERARNAEVRASLRDRQRQEVLVAKLENASGMLRGDAEGGGDLRSNRACEQRRNRVANLAKTMPVCGVEAEPIGIGVQTCGFTHRDASGRIRVDRPGRRERTAITRGARAKRGRKPVRVKARKTADRIAGTGNHRSKASALRHTMARPARTSKQTAVKIPPIREVVRKPEQPSQAAGINRARAEGGPNGVAVKQLRNRADLRQIADRVTDRDTFGPKRRVARKNSVRPGTDEEKSTPILRHASVSRIQDAPRQHDAIAGIVKIPNHRVKDCGTRSALHPRHVLEGEVGRTQLADQSGEMVRKRIARIVPLLACPSPRSLDRETRRRRRQCRRTRSRQHDEGSDHRDPRCLDRQSGKEGN